MTLGWLGIERLLRSPAAGWGAALLAAVLLAAAAAGCDRGGKTGGAEAGGSAAEKSAAAKGDKSGPEGGGKGEKHVEEVRLTEVAVQKYGIKLDQAAKRVLTPTVTVPGRVSINVEQTSQVGVPVAGRIVDLRVRLGDVVSKGDVLLVVDSPDLGEAQSDYVQRRTTVGVAGPAVELAQSAYDRAQKLFNETQGIALTEVQKRQGELQAAQGALKTAQASVVAAENKLRLLGMDQPAIDALAKSGQVNAKYEVRAPIGGQVIDRRVTQGEFVRPDRDAALLVLADLSTLWVIADVPQAELAAIAVGSRARVSGVSGSAAPIEGKVSYIAPQIDPGTRTAPVRVEVKSEGSPLRAGMFVMVEIDSTRPGEAPAPVVAVPEEAVQTVEGSPAVFVPVGGEPNTFAKRPVKVGPAVGGWVPVLSGLKEGEQLVVASTFILKADLGKSAAEED